MPSLGDILSAALAQLGWPGLLVAIFLIFMVDSMVIPTLPELFTIAFYLQYGSLGLEPVTWAVAILAMAVLGEIAGNGSIYLIVSRLLVQKKRMPKLIDKAVKAWSQFLIVRGERVILVNRFAPAVPFLGVFIAVCNWRVRRSFLYIVLGSLVKYSLLLALVGWLSVEYDPQLAQWLTLAAVVVIVALSVAAAIIRRKRILGKAPPAQKN
jgi:membrane protein DedA with SNARE-associated domain